MKMKIDTLWQIAAATLITASATAQNTFPSTGNVGIGTTSPTSALQITTASSSNGALRIYDSSGGEASVGYIGSSGDQWVAGVGGWGITGSFTIGDSTIGLPRFVIDSSGKVGMGTTSPAAPLQVLGNVMVGNPAPDCDSPSGIQFYGGVSNLFLDCSQNLYMLSGATINTSSQLVANTASPTVIFAQNDGFHFLADTGKSPGSPYTPTERLSILNSSGNVGIGTASPGSRLEVNGNIKLSSGSGASVTFADGTIQSTAWTGTLCGGDYAESVDISGDRTKYQPGDVLVVDTANPGHFLKAAEPYSTLVAGIYSTKPGLVGRRQTTDAKISTTEVPMAMVGIVPTKVSAENGPIRPGDLLVTSSTVGYVMKGTDRNQLTGAIVGKALGSLASGTGVVEVLVTLQ